MQYDFIINYSSYLGVLLIGLFLLFHDYLNNNIKRKNIILFFIMFIIYVVMSEIFYNTNIKYLYLNAKKYKDISYYTKLYKKNQFNEETLINRTLAKYEILVKFYNGYFDCYKSKDLPEDNPIPIKCRKTRLKASIVNDIQNDFSKIKNLNDQEKLIKCEFLTFYTDYVSAQNYINEVIPKVSDNYEFYRYAALNEFHSFNTFRLLHIINRLKNSKKDIYSDKNLYNEYIKQQSKIYKLYEKFLNELNTKNTNNYELAVFYHEFALLKEYLFDEYGAQKEYEKTLNYIKKIDLNKIDNISLQKYIKEFERHIKHKNEYFLYALE